MVEIEKQDDNMIIINLLKRLYKNKILNIYELNSENDELPFHYIIGDKIKINYMDISKIKYVLLQILWEENK
jgi:hypothetical protein